MTNGSDSVSIVMPILNEYDYLSNAINSLLHGGYPKDKMEFVIVDGGSTDGSLALIDELSKKSDLDIKLLYNQKKITPYAMNMGIEKASHKIILRADAHAIYSEGYIQKSVRLLQENKGDNVGGRLIMMANKSMFSQVLSLVLNSKLGNGGAKYRSTGGGRLVDTVWCGCWYKTTLTDVGLFDVNWVTNQDAELNARLISKGYRIYSDPSIEAKLLVRSSFFSFLKQYFRYGYGRFKTFLRYPSSLRIRQIMPLVAVFCLFSALVFAAEITLWFLLLSFPVSALLFMPKAREKKIPTIYLFWVLPILIGMNLAWVLGAFYGMSMSIFRK